MTKREEQVLRVQIIQGVLADMPQEEDQVGTREGEDKVIFEAEKDLARRVRPVIQKFWEEEREKLSAMTAEPVSGECPAEGTE